MRWCRPLLLLHVLLLRDCAATAAEKVQLAGVVVVHCSQAMPAPGRQGLEQHLAWPVHCAAAAGSKALTRSPHDPRQPAAVEAAAVAVGAAAGAVVHTEAAAARCAVLAHQGGSMCPGPRMLQQVVNVGCCVWYCMACALSSQCIGHTFNQLWQVYEGVVKRVRELFPVGLLGAMLHGVDVLLPHLSCRCKFYTDTL